MAHFLFNCTKPRERAAALLRVGMWGVDAGERHRDALAAGDLVLIYLAAPKRDFIARAELATAAHDWTPQEAQAYPGDSTGGVLLTQIDEWEPPVSMTAVLSEIGPGGNAKADFATGVVQISAREYEAALAVQASAQ